MRLDCWDITAFGPLADFRVEGLANHPLVVVQGDNESGKSTLSEFLVAMLYGFRPAQGDGHPYAPWSGADAAGSLEVLLADGRRAAVQRSLGLRPEGLLRDERGEQELGNRPVPWTGPLTREMFRALHAIGLEDLARLDGDVWKQLEERLLAGTSFPFLRPAGEALAALDADASRLWMPSGGDETLHRRLAVELRLLERKREQALARNRRALELRGLVVAQDWKIGQLTEQLREAQSRLERAETLLPVLRGLEEIDELRERASQALPTDAFSDDPRTQLQRLEADLADHAKEIDRLETEIEHHELHGQLTQPERDILEVEEEVRALVNDSSVHHQDKVHLNDLDRARDADEALLAERASVVLAAGLNDGVRESLSRLNLNELQSRVKDFEEAKSSPELSGDLVNRAREAVSVAQHDLEELPSAEDERKLQRRAEALQTLQSREAVLAVMKQELEGTAEPTPVALDKDKKLMGLGLLGMAALLVVVIVAGGTDDGGLVGTLAGVLAAAGIFVLRRKGAQAPGPDEARYKILTRECSKLRRELELHEYEAPEPHLKDVHQILTVAAARPTLERRLVNARRREKEAVERQEKAQRELEDARTAIAEYLSGADIAGRRLENPGYDLVADIESMRNTLRNMARIQGERTAIAARAAEREGRARHLAELLDMVPPTQPMDAVPLWQDRLHQALMARRRSDEAERQLPKLRARLEETRGKLQRDRTEHETLAAALAAIDPDGDAHDGLKLVERAREWRRRAEALEAALHERWPDWAERGAEARAARTDGADLDLPTEEKVALRQQAERLEQSLASLAEEKARLAAEQSRLAGEEELADVEGALLALRARQRHLLRERDRIALAASVVREAAARWREHHQPAVMRTASRYLHTITGGRYDRVGAELRDGRWRLVTQASTHPYPVPLGRPLSRATRDQVQLALRAALAAELEGGEPMPLLLDDVFLRWDEARLAHGVELLGQLGKRRQVVVLTTSPATARLLAQAGGHLVRAPGRAEERAGATHAEPAGAVTASAVPG